jgi:catechol 2,3-dioxygenase-like lactoylglutathione lyase family enzyme
MEFHFGRLIDHVQLRVADLEASRRFYQATLRALGRDLSGGGDWYFHADELFVTAAGEEPVSRVHLAFQTRDQAHVDAVYQAMLGAGGRDNGPPGFRDYHRGYYGAFVLDPDGNNIEAVYHGPADRSATSVVLTPTALPDATA